MYWEEDDKSDKPLIDDDMVDVSFAIRCRTLPVDHAHALASAVMEILPWIEAEFGAGVHTIHVAESGNGWQRPQDILHPSRRTRLVLRVPGKRLAETEALAGQTLDVDGHSLIIEKQTDTRQLSPLTTLFTRYLVSPDNETDEENFLHRVSGLLADLDIRPRKMLCGREQSMRLGDRILVTRSLMIADLEAEEALRLQKNGLGSHRYMGCGIFIPHKSIKEVSN